MQFIPKNLFKKSFLSLFVAIFLFAPHAIAKPVVHHTDTALKKATQTNIANDDLRGEDLTIRKAAIEALGKRAGTVVVMNAQNGRIYTIVNQKWAIEDGFKPCSTIKLVTGVAGYKEGLIRSNGNLARGKYRIGLDMALAYSNNDYFQLVGKHLGSAKMINYAKQLGLGSITGINAGNEYAGQLPYGNENLRIYSHADDYRVTPLQLAVMVSAITNGGKVLVPRIPYTRREKTNFKGSYRETLNIKPAVFERVIPGMMGAVKYGTAGRIKNTNLKIAGKTGSCIARKTWVGLFASVAPIQNPKYSVVAILRGKYARGKYSAAIAEKVYQALLPSYDRKFNRNLARKTIRVNSAPKTNSATTAKVIETNKPRRPRTKTRKSTKKSSPIRNTVITYRKPPKSESVKPKPIKPKTKPKAKKPKERFPTIVIEGKTEITRPRIVGNR